MCHSEAAIRRRVATVLHLCSKQVLELLHYLHENKHCFIRDSLRKQRNDPGKIGVGNNLFTWAKSEIYQNFSTCILSLAK